MVVKHAPNGWSLRLARSYPVQEQMVDFWFAKENSDAPDILVGTRNYYKVPISDGIRGLLINRLEGVPFEFWTSVNLEVLVHMLLIQMHFPAWAYQRLVPETEIRLEPREWPSDKHLIQSYSPSNQTA